MLMLALSPVLCFCPTNGEHSAVIYAWGFAGCVDLEIRLQIPPISFESHYNVIGYCAIGLRGLSLESVLSCLVDSPF